MYVYVTTLVEHSDVPQGRPLYHPRPPPPTDLPLTSHNLQAELAFRFVAALDDLDDLNPTLGPNLNPNLDDLGPNLNPAGAEVRWSSVASRVSSWEMQGDGASCRVLRCSVSPPQSQAVQAMSNPNPNPN